MTHMIPRIIVSVEPWLKQHVLDARFWNGEFDTSHTGDFTLPEPSKEDRLAMLERFKEQPSLLGGKKVIPVLVPTRETT